MVETDTRDRGESAPRSAMHGYFADELVASANCTVVGQCTEEVGSLRPVLAGVRQLEGTTGA